MLGFTMKGGADNAEVQNKEFRNARVNSSQWQNSKEASISNVSCSCGD